MRASWRYGLVARLRSSASLAACCAWLAAGCEGEGELSLKFGWEDAAPTEPHWLSVTVYDARAGAESGVIASNGHPWGGPDDGNSLGFDKLHYETAYFADVELFPCEDPDNCAAPTLPTSPDYAGRSQQFVLVHGEHTEVHTQLISAPSGVVVQRALLAGSETAEQALGVQVQTAVPRRVGHHCVPLLLAAGTAHLPGAVEISSVSAATPGSGLRRCRLPAPNADATAATEGLEDCGIELLNDSSAAGVTEWHMPGWSLCAGEGKCAPAQGAPGCPASDIVSGEVHVRFARTELHSMELHSIEYTAYVDLDDRAPVVSPKVSPSVAGPKSDVCLDLIANEDLGECGPISAFRQDDSGAWQALADVVPAPMLTEDLRRCHICFAGNTLLDGEYAFGERVRDLVGNAGCLERESCDDQCPGGTCELAADTSSVLRVDSALPKLREKPESTASWPKRKLLPDEPVPFELEFDERVEPMVVTLDGQTLGVTCTPKDVDHRQFSCSVSAALDSGDGLRQLAARVTDEAGNSGEIRLGQLDFDVDVPHATATLTRIPEFSRNTGQGGSAATWFTATDPFDKQAVRARLTVLTDKTTLTPTLELVEADVSVPERPSCPENGDTAATLPATMPVGLGKSFGFEARIGELIAQLGVAAQRPRGRALYCLRARFERAPRGSRVLEPLLGLSWGTPENRLALDQTLFQRRPWGSAGGSEQPDFSVQAFLQASAGDEPFPVSDVVLSTDPRGEARIASTANSRGFDPASAGPVQIQLPQSLSPNLVELYAASVDVAGNVSDFRLIERGQWLATLNRHGPFANPHRAFALGAAPPMLEPSDPGEPIDEQLSRLGAAPADSTAEVQWFQLLTGRDEDVPPARSGHALAYDAARGVTVLFGGEAHCARMLDDTWEWDGLRWQQLHPVGRRPSPRRDTRMVYDAARGRTLLFGGTPDSNAPDNGTPLADTWEWDGRAWTQRADGPPRYAHALAYDPRRGEVLLMGGVSNTGPCSADTWRWNGEHWLQVEAAGDDLCRSNHAMTFDTHMGQDQHGALLLFGGVNLNTCATLRDTWVWSGEHWEPVSTPTPSPPTTQHSMVTDEEGRAVALGGAEALLACEGDPDAFKWPKPQEPLVWHASGAASGEWQVNSTSPAPCSTELDEDHCVFIDHASAFDSARKQLVTVGGRINREFVEPPLRRTWLLDGTSWHEPPSTAGIVDDPSEDARHCPAQDDPRVPTSAPSARAGHSLIAVPDANSVALFGGHTASGDVVGDTWSWDGSRWLPQAEGEPSPSPRYQHALFGLDATSALLFGGRSGLDENEDENEDVLGDAWTLSFSRAAGEWQWEEQALGACSAIANVARHSAAVTGSGFAFGGSTATAAGTGDLLSWNAGCWTVLGTVGPRPDARRTAALAAFGSSLLLFAGDSVASRVLGDTWRYDIQTQTWAPILPAPGVPAPEGRAGHTLTPSASGGSVLLLGGQVTGDGLDDAWLFDGQGWTKVSASSGAPQPGPLAQHAAVVPPGSTRGLLFGGTQFTSDEATNQTWAWAFPDHPAHTVLVDASGIGCAEPGAEQISARRLVLTRVKVHAVAGGGPAPTGAELWVWNGQRWVSSRAFNEAGPAALAPVDWETSDRETLRALAAGRTLGVQLRPLARPEPSPARLLTDLVEVALDYRLDAAAPEAAHDTSFCSVASLRAP